MRLWTVRNVSIVGQFIWRCIKQNASCHVLLGQLKACHWAFCNLSVCFHGTGVLVLFMKKIILFFVEWIVLNFLCCCLVWVCVLCSHVPLVACCKIDYYVVISVGAGASWSDLNNLNIGYQISQIKQCIKSFILTVTEWFILSCPKSCVCVCVCVCAHACTHAHTHTRTHTHNRRIDRQTKIPCCSALLCYPGET